MSEPHVPAGKIAVIITNRRGAHVYSKRIDVDPVSTQFFHKTYLEQMMFAIAVATVRDPEFATRFIPRYHRLKIRYIQPNEGGYNEDEPDH